MSDASGRLKYHTEGHSTICCARIDRNNRTSSRTRARAHARTCTCICTGTPVHIRVCISVGVADGEIANALDVLSKSLGVRGSQCERQNDEGIWWNSGYGSRCSRRYRCWLSSRRSRRWRCRHTDRVARIRRLAERIAIDTLAMPAVVVLVDAIPAVGAVARLYTHAVGDVAFMCVAIARMLR